MDQFNHVNIKQEDDGDQKEVSIKNKEKRQDKEGSLSRHDNTSLLNIYIKQEFDDDDEHKEVLINNEEKQLENKDNNDVPGSPQHDNTSPSNVYIKQEFDDVEQNEALLNNTQQHSVQSCTKVKIEGEGGEIKLEWDGDECDCEECRVEREIKIEFNQINETEQFIRSLGPSEENKGASQQCKCVKKKKDEEDDCEYIGLWDKDCGCKRCTRNRKVSIEINQTNATENQQVNPGPCDAEEDASCKLIIQVNKRLEKEKGAQDRAKHDELEEQGLLTEVGLEDGECQMRDESEDNETEIDDDAYEMELDGDESSDEETEVDEQFDREPESNSLKYKMVQKTAQIEIVRIGKLYKCTFEGCGKQSKCSRDLMRHIRTHEFNCTWSGCCKTYSTQEKVRKHYLQHTREKESFKCTWKSCSEGIPKYTDLVKTKGSSDRIKRPINAFNVWARTVRRKIVELRPNMHHSGISNKLARCWRGLTEKQRQPFVDEAERLRLLHIKQYSDYYKLHPLQRRLI